MERESQLSLLAAQIECAKSKADEAREVGHAEGQVQLALLLEPLLLALVQDAVSQALRVLRGEHLEFRAEQRGQRGEDVWLVIHHQKGTLISGHC